MQSKRNWSIPILKRRRLFNFFKITVSFLCLLFLFFELRHQNSSFQNLDLPQYFMLTLSLLCFLMLVNWHLEALRWKVSISSFESLSLKEAYAEVLRGLAMNWIFPFTSGDLLSRLNKRLDRHQAISALMLNRVIMLFLTAMIGTYGIYKFGHLYFELLSLFPFLVLFVLAGILLVRQHLDKFLKYFSGLSKRILFQIISISILRYFVFTFQFFVLIRLFIPEIDVDVLVAGIGWVFFFRSALPTILGGIGVREVSALVFFQGFVSDISYVVFPIFILWLVNTLLPSFVGGIMILRMDYGFKKA